MVLQEEITIVTGGRASIDLTNQINEIVKTSGIKTGICNIFIKHTSASLMLCENADPTVRSDMEMIMQRIAPDGDPAYQHTCEGPDDMAAHIRTIITDSGLNIPVKNGNCALGTWQGIFLWEHRYNSHTRQIVVTIYGD